MHVSYCIYSKYRRKAMFGALRKEVGEIFGKVCRMEESKKSRYESILIGGVTARVNK